VSTQGKQKPMQINKAAPISIVFAGSLLEAAAVISGIGSAALISFSRWFRFSVYKCITYYTNTKPNFT
jgi:hypothetical protein